MDKRPIEGIMQTTMESIRDMVDVNTVIGDPVVAGDGSTVIPVSKVCFGFVAGGGEYECGGRKKSASDDQQQGNSGETPFAGGAGAGVTLQPMGFLVVAGGQVRLLPAQYYAPLDRVIELAPQVLTEIKNWIAGLCNQNNQNNPNNQNATPAPPKPQGN